MNRISMKPASPEQAVFAEALLRATPEARAAYLSGACGTDDPSRQPFGFDFVKSGS